jgi:hypothetical protein
MSIFGMKRHEVTGDWGKLHNEELHNFCSTPYKCMRWTGPVARMGAARIVHRIFVGKPERKRPLRRPNVGGYTMEN